MDLINGGLNNQISTVGRLVYANRPNSDTWQVEFFTVWDCGLSPHRCWQQVNEAEQIMIRKYQPCLNIEHNRYPRAFPDSYILPPNELPDKFICNPKARKARTECYISYYAYDWKTRRKKEYKSIMYAHSSDECQTAVIKLLGYQPESLNIMTCNEMRYGKVRPF